MNNFLEHFSRLAERQPDSIAMVDMGGQRETSFADMKLLTGRVTARLLGLGYPRGSFIVINMGRRMEYIAAYYGIIAAGYAVVPTVPDVPEGRLSYIIRDSGSPFTVTEDFFEGIEDYEPVYCTGPAPDDIVCMNYTSGSTGKPKGVYYSMRCVSESILRAGMLFEGLGRIVTAATASLAFAAMCHDCLAPMALGGTVHLLSNEVRSDANLMMEYFEKHGIVCGNVSPGMLKYFRHTKGLQRVLSTGERVVNAYSDQHEIWCVYGLTEAFTAVSYFPIDRKYQNTPLGKPFGGVRIDILDEDGNPLPDGSEGEIFVTWYLAEGYYGMPEATASCFTDLGGGMKRFATHDIGYKDPEGNLVYVDRKDWMIKINGQRVEPFGVEAVINDVPGVKSAVVKSFTDADSVYLCAYYISGDDTLSADDIRQAISSKLPAYMMPAFLVRMDAFPRTVSGKVDRKALEAPSHSDYLTVYAPPETKEEEAVCTAMQKVLNIERVGRNDDFFLLGGNSLKVMALISALGYNSLKTLDIAKRRTPARIAEVLSQKSLIDTSRDAACRKKAYPLTQYQGHYYLYWEYDGDTAMGNTPEILSADKNYVTAEELADAVYKVLQNHPALSTLIYEDDRGIPMQRFDPSLITRPAITSCTEEEFETIRKNLIRPFDLKGHKLYRCELYSTDINTYLFLDIHHIVTDAISGNVILNQLMSVLGGAGDLPADYYCSWLQRVQKIKNNMDKVLMPDETYDRYPAFDRQGDGCDTETIRIELTMRVSDFRKSAHRAGVSPLEILISTALKSLADYNGCSRAAVNWILSERDMRIKQDMVGLLLASMPVPVDLSSKVSGTDLIKEIRRINKNNILYSDLSPGNCSGRPVIDDTMTVNYIPYDEEESIQMAGGMTRESLINSNKAHSSVFYLIVEEMAAQSPLTLLFRYNSESYRRDSMQRFTDIFMKTLLKDLEAEDI